MSETLTITEVKLIPHSTREQRQGHRMRIYFTPEDFSVVQDFLGERRDRPWKAYRETFPELFGKVALEGATIIAGLMNESNSLGGIKWSQKAGCSCGCSPAFIVHGVYGSDVFVTVKGPRTNYQLETGEELIPLPEQSPLEFFISNL